MKKKKKEKVAQPEEGKDKKELNPPITIPARGEPDKKVEVKKKGTKIILRHADFCDACSELKRLQTLAGHKRCQVYGKVKLSRPDLEISSRGLGSILRPEECKKECQAEIRKDTEVRKEK